MAKLPIVVVQTVLNAFLIRALALLRLLLNLTPFIAAAVEQVLLADCTAPHFLLPPYAAQHASVADMPIAVTFIRFG